jgi:hypothetical protein
VLLAFPDDKFAAGFAVAALICGVLAVILYAISA